MKRNKIKFVIILIVVCILIICIYFFGNKKTGNHIEELNRINEKDGIDYVYNDDNTLITTTTNKELIKMYQDNPNYDFSTIDTTIEKNETRKYTIIEDSGEYIIYDENKNEILRTYDKNLAEKYK